MFTNELSDKWVGRFMQMAVLNATFSKDPSTKVGAVITEGNRIISMGFNGFPHGVSDKLDVPREVKYAQTIHAECNAILHAQRDLQGCSIFVTHMCCANCAAQVIQVGIKDVYVPEPSEDMLSRWGEQFEITKQMFKETGVRVHMQPALEENKNERCHSGGCCN